MHAGSRALEKIIKLPTWLFVLTFLFTCYFLYNFLLFFHKEVIIVFIVVVGLYGVAFFTTLYLLFIKKQYLKGILFGVVWLVVYRLLFYGLLPVYSLHPKKYKYSDVDHFILTIRNSPRRAPLEEAIPNHKLVFGYDRFTNITKFFNEMGINETGLDQTKLKSLYTLVGYSHRKAFNESYHKSNKTWVVIFEDDAYPISGYKNKLETVINYDFDIIWLTTKESVWYSLFGWYTYCFVGMAYRRSVLPRLIEEFHINSPTIRKYYMDTNVYELRWTTDRFLADECQRGSFNCAVFPLVRERITTSTISAYLDVFK